MNKKISLGTVIALILIVIAVTFSITMVYSSEVFSDKMYAIKEREALYSKLSEIDNIVRTKSISNVNNEVLMDAIADGYISGIKDPFAKYITAAEYMLKTKKTEKNIGEIGIEVYQNDSGYMCIEEIIPDSPAEEVGLYPGDLIIEIDETEVNKENYDSCLKMLQDDPGTLMSIKIRRDVNEKVFEITRRIIEKPVVQSNIFDKYGYIKITSFDQTTPNQFNRVLDDLISSHVEGLVFDVRNTTGGDLDSVCTVLDKLLPEGPIVSAKYKQGNVELLYSSDSFEINLPMVVVTNRHSSDAAEIFAQALKDYKKAKSVGNTTAGKGLMQNYFKLTDGSMMKITVAEYVMPVSDSYNGVGVKADFEVSIPAELEDKLDVIGVQDDAQLRKALEVLIGSAKQETSTESSSQENSDEK